MTYVIYEKTNIQTPLGPIVIVEATSEGLILVAGPSTNVLMKKVIGKLKKYSPTKILVDGALFRKSIASTRLVDAVILVTGASYSKEIKTVVKDTKSLIDQLRLNVIESDVRNYVINTESNIFIDSNKHQLEVIDKSLVANENLIEEYLNDSFDYFYIKGALTNRIIDVFLKNRNNFTNMNIIVKDGTHIVANHKNYNKLEKIGVKVYALNQIDILFVAYNPFSPYNYKFDNSQFKKELKKEISQDLINVLKDLE